MTINNFLKTIIILVTGFLSQANAQNNQEITKSVNIDKVTENKNNEISANLVKKSIDDIFSPSKLTSIMFNDEQYSNVEKAIEALRNNQEFIPEGEEAKKLSEEEAKKQEEEIKEFQKNEDNAKSYIFLSSIMFFSEKSWSLWINDKKFLAQSNNPENELYFKNISQNQLTVVWKLSISKWKILSGKKSEELAPKINKDNQVEVEFTLKPNQTFMLSSNKVVDGRVLDSNKRR